MADDAGQPRAARVRAPAVGRRRRRPRLARRSSRSASSTSSAVRPMRASSIRGSRRRRSSTPSIRSAAACAWTSAVRPPWRAWRRCCAKGSGAGDPYDLVHFDGHGTFLPQAQIGALLFEKPDDGSGASETDLVPADRLGNLLASYTIPLVVLEACRSATVGKTAVFRSVAPRLIQAGVGSVLSMGHAVHVEAARLLLDRFYRELVRGTTIGHAVAEARKALISTPARWIESGPGGRTVKLRRLVPAAPLPARQQTTRSSRPMPSGNSRCGSSTSSSATSTTTPPASKRSPASSRRSTACAYGWTNGRSAPGNLQAQCETGIKNSRFTVVAGSQTALQSKWVQWEIEKHNELNPRGRPADPDQVRAARSPSRARRPALGRFHRPCPGRRQRRVPRPAHPRRRRRGRPPPPRLPQPGHEARGDPAPSRPRRSMASRAGRGSCTSWSAGSAPIAASCCTPWAAWARPRSPPRPRTGGRAAACSAMAPAS